MKLCKDCKNAQPQWVGGYLPGRLARLFGAKVIPPIPVLDEHANCLVAPPDPVNGWWAGEDATLRVMRKSGACGPEGKLFEPKTPEAA